MLSVTVHRAVNLSHIYECGFGAFDVVSENMLTDNHVVQNGEDLVAFQLTVKICHVCYLLILGFILLVRGATSSVIRINSRVKISESPSAISIHD